MWTIKIKAALLGFISLCAAASGYAAFVIAPREARPNSGSLVVEFQRLAASENLPAIFKMMEGAHLEIEPDMSSPSLEQFWVTDGENRFHLVGPTFSEIWQNHQLNGLRPVNNAIWNTLASDLYSQRGLVTLASTAELAPDTEIQSIAWNLACQEVMGDYVFDIFGSGNPYSDAAGVLIEDWDFRNCHHANYAPLDFFYTLATITNYSDGPITNIQVTYTDGSEEIASVLDYTLDGFFGTCPFHPWEIYGEDLIRQRVQCTEDLLSALQDPETPSGAPVTRSISVLPPGESIAMILNAYVPNSSGLPGTYILGHVQLNQIRYTESGYTFEVDEPRPLANDRLGIIESPSGGMGGQ